MTQVSIATASRLVGLDRKSLYRHIKQGRLTATISATGERQVDISELIRCYGPLKTTDDSRATSNMPQAETTNETANLKLKLAAADAELSQLRARLSEKDEHISDLRDALHLLTGPNKKTTPWWKFWR